jgi:hypothetical protein
MVKTHNTQINNSRSSYLFTFASGDIGNHIKEMNYEGNILKMFCIYAV